MEIQKRSASCEICSKTLSWTGYKLGGKITCSSCSSSCFSCNCIQKEILCPFCKTNFKTKLINPRCVEHGNTFREIRCPFCNR